MTWAESLRATWREAAVFAVVFFPVSVVIGFLSGITMGWSQTILGGVIAVVLYWIVTAVFRDRKTR